MQNQEKYDLHMHSTHSDGLLTPKALVDMACSLELGGISITDHDCTSGYQEAKVYAREKGVDLIAGIELSSTFQNQSVHVLGYGFDINHPKIVSYCEAMVGFREQRLTKILDKLAKRNMPLKLEEIRLQIQDSAEVRNKSAIIGRMHIAHALLNKGFVHSIPEAFSQYLGDGLSCYVALECFPFAQAVETIQEAGGIAVLAHPHMMKLKTVKKLLELKILDGIEVFYGNLVLDKEQVYQKLALDYQLFMSGGSDFHFPSPHRRLGMSFVLRDNLPHQLRQGNVYLN